MAEFPVVGSSSTGFGSWCKECKSKYQQNYDYKEKNNKRRSDRIKWFRSIKADKPCTDCGLIYEPACMDYDHVRGEKIAHVSRMVLDNTPKSKILKEIDKCELICLLCHNRRTQKRFYDKGSNKYPPYVQRNIDIINQHKNKPCEYYKLQYESFNMQFDHIDPMVKDYNVCQLKSAKFEKLMLEISRCRVLCALCHRRKAIMEQKDGLYPKTRTKVVKVKTFIDMNSLVKECTQCREILSFDKFGKNVKVKCGFSSWCKDCTNQSKREKRAIDKVSGNNFADT